MSISYLGTITTASTLEDCVDNSSNGYILACISNKVQIYNTSTRSQVGSDITTTNSTNASICLVNNASAVVWTGTTNVDLIEISSGTKKNIAGVVALLGAAKGQQSAGDVTNNRAMSVAGQSGTAATVSLLDGNTYTGSNFKITPLYNESTSAFTTCITLRTSDRWLVGSNMGNIYEIDHLGNVYKVLKIPQLPNTGFTRAYNAKTNTAVSQGVITGLSFDGTDLLAVTTYAGLVYIFSYSTGICLSITPFSNQGGLALPLCRASSGTTFLSGNGTYTNNVVAEFNYTTTPPQVRDTLFLDSTSLVIACGCQNGIGWVARANNKISTFSVTPISKTTISSTIQYPSGTAVQGRVIRVVDPGVGSAYVSLDTEIVAGTTSLPIESGASVIELSIVNTGTNTVAQVTRNQT